MKKQYQIENADGSIKKGCEEINCSYMEIDGTVLKFFVVDESAIDDSYESLSTMEFAYNLAPGESVTYVGEF